MTKAQADEHAIHICRTLGVDEDCALLSGLATYLMGLVAAEALDAALEAEKEKP